MDFSPEEIERYARHLVLADVGGPGQQKLKRARVVVIGVGGLGSPAIQYLAAAGVGTLRLVDADTVSLSNLQRQVIHDTIAIDRPKVDQRFHVARLNPHVAVRGGSSRFARENAGLIAGADVVRGARRHTPVPDFRRVFPRPGAARHPPPNRPVRRSILR
jgi:molybdopterin/thiamine biosynthesis adenylyltransferase